ncbi:MAG TPA: hypothetical protein VGD45_07095 [Steroidobacter sp.]|uniref:hypothetical protein n=1 Tax=Steroidobacter sp. TaxID=1978227 RepID=UPI002ED83983
MGFRICVRNLLLSCVLASGFVMQAQAEDDPASEATPPPATDEADKERRETVEFERVAKQYQKSEKDGETLYCRKEKTLGTRIAKTVCLTTTQLRDRIRNAEAQGVAKPQVGGCRPPTC